MKKCPCINCICVARCRHKTYTQLVRDCKPFVDYILKTRRPCNPTARDYKKLSKAVEVLKPICWKIMRSSFRGEDSATVVWTKEGMRLHPEYWKSSYDP